MAKLRTVALIQGTFTMSGTLATIRHEANIAILSIDDGKANVFSPAMAKRLQECFDEVGPDVGAVVVMGRPGIFSAGFDLKTINAGDSAATAKMVSMTVRMAMDVMTFPRPVVGAATGHCIAMGALFMMTMDYRLGALGNFKVGLNEVGDGLVLPIFAVELARYRLPTASLISSTQHAVLCDPEGALKAGFLDEVVDADSLLDTALARAKRLSTLPNPAYRLSKSNLVAPVRDRILSTLEADLDVS
ncbi:MAG: crotonase/enoyl-CoA hydratase family protein [Planctomycetia bacterium]|nr:crotonase/enoyl-CoA hydratase family protein [Planctomycetia bacterium]